MPTRLRSTKDRDTNRMSKEALAKYQPRVKGPYGRGTGVYGTPWRCVLSYAAVCIAKLLSSPQVPIASVTKYPLPRVQSSPTH